MRHLLPLLLTVGVAGCGPQESPATGRPSGPTSPPQTSGPRPTGEQKAAPNVGVTVSPNELTVKKGGTARAAIVGLPPGVAVVLDVEPAASGVTATTEGAAAVVVSAGAEAKGPATVTVRAGGEVAKIAVTVE